MITTLIGKTFLKAYNEKYGKSYSAKEFFEEEYFELFFNHPKYMQWITNSPFVQGITTSDEGEYGIELCKTKIKEETVFSELYKKAIQENGKERITLKTDKSKGVVKILLKNDLQQRQSRLLKFNENISNGARDGSIAIGYPASEENGYGTYSGLVSDLYLDISDEDVYFSWIGAGLGIGMAGRYSLLVNKDEINLELFEGWKHYRKLLEDATLSKLKGNQINTWNGQWLTYRLGKRYKEEFDFSNLEDEGMFKIEDSLIQVDTVNWSNLFFSLSNSFPNEVINSYVYSIGDKNNTIGFIPIYLKAGKKLIEVFKQLFHTDLPFNNKDFQSLFGMHIKRACELGNIGLHALRPDNLKKYMEEDKNLSFKKEEDNLIYQSFKTWLIAMLSKNKEEITDYTSKIAKILLKYKNSGKGNSRITLIEKELLQSKSKKNFLDSLTTVILDAEDECLNELKSFRDEIHLMTNEEFGYLLTLLKFDYVFIQRKS